MVKIMLKRVLSSVIGLAIAVLGALWLYGFIGVKAGWIGPTEVPQLNAVSHHGAEPGGDLLHRLVVVEFTVADVTPVIFARAPSADSTDAATCSACFAMAWGLKWYTSRQSLLRSNLSQSA